MRRISTAGSKRNSERLTILAGLPSSVSGLPSIVGSNRGYSPPSTPRCPRVKGRSSTETPGGRGWRKPGRHRCWTVPGGRPPAAWGTFIVVGFYGQPTNLIVLEADTGRTVWQNSEEKTFRVTSTPAIGDDGTVYAVSNDTLVRAFDVETGAMKWSTALEQTRCMGTPALAGGRLFVPSGDGTLHGLDSETGRVLWVWLYALEAQSGRELWSFDLGTPALSTPAVSGTGLWTGACEESLHAFTGRSIP